jgi:hypothetical protein
MFLRDWGIRPDLADLHTKKDPAAHIIIFATIVPWATTSIVTTLFSALAWLVVKYTISHVVIRTMTSCCTAPAGLLDHPTQTDQQQHMHRLAAVSQVMGSAPMCTASRETAWPEAEELKGLFCVASGRLEG